MRTNRRNVVRRAVAAAAIALGPTMALLTSPVAAQSSCPVSAGDQAVDAEELELLGLLNQYRADHGRNTLSLSTAATRAAAWFSRDMASKNYTPFNHVDSNGRDIAQRLTWCGVTWNQFAENIYWGSGDGTAAFNWWRNSAVHDANMLATGITHAGIARAFDASSTFGWYWTLDLTAGEPQPSVAVVGATFYSDGSSSRSGPSGARVSAFATSAEPGYAYKLVSGRAGPTGRPCTADVVVVNGTPRFANAQGVIAQTAGTLTRPRGTWQVCFLAEGQIVTGAASYTVA